MSPRTDERVRTLVVEDDRTIARLHRGFVESHPGFVVVAEAHTGDEALRAVTLFDPELVLLDIYLPDTTGLHVLRQIRRRPGPPVDVIATTAARELDTVREAMAGGVQHYLVKPFTAAALRERLDEVLRFRAGVRAVHGELDQAGVDALVQGRGPTPTLPKGLSPRSLDRVAAALAHAPADAGLSAAEVAAATGMARVSARRYLEHLVACGRASVDPRYGGTGRPENGFRPV
ncbi:response regulator of citrate/malate metabolism [Sediminihabitans luteus]|uniref:Transcriptional regulatory protein n=1 Tax=Sediminihabitans luteus TaxID=1138585 RepID=A0A2M9D0H9_9CELL|nr:response regulator [Sediminihabitans luteus]PJJ77660.1 response regulator of citrate/malate metabolism [Sediminihabitans luteus]GII98560.1 transcriptional regulatory protein [Sediminihabitans luteus]